MAHEIKPIEGIRYFSTPQSEISIAIRVIKDHVVRLGNVDWAVELDDLCFLTYRERDRKIFFPYDGTAYADYKLSAFQDKEKEGMYRYYLDGMIDGPTNDETMASNMKYIFEMDT